ncbi:MAG: bifunctional phosphopantothenoylcysteine decarboxylase/phosphopantothenate--cysteine ligase CoaBC [Myxococcota bacterium]|nr:bifunctional phosphopantothenoylcysteine decarboxylase/phosphopantothenate--cysteine ligase CoaBC [Myxococcota bacterium]
MLAGRTIHLCVTGGIAAYKAAELARLMIKAGAQVQVAMTENAQNFIGALTFQALTQRPVYTLTLDPTEELEIGHIAFAQDADAIVVAPATANIIAKAAMGIADDLVSTILSATDRPVVVAPAMNTTMYHQQTVQDNLETLRERGWAVVPPAEGELACGAIGPGRLAEHSSIINTLVDCLTKTMPLLGKRVLVTAGPTRERLDPVRFMSNPSTGRMGLAVAEAAVLAGAQVTLIHGPTELDIPASIEAVPIESAREMYDAVLSRIETIDALFMSAAVADWTPETVSETKQKKVDGPLVVKFVRTPDILAEVGRRRRGHKPILVGWAAETESVLEAARAKLSSKKVDMIVGNNVSEPGCGFGTDTNAVILVEEHAVTPLAMQPKAAIGRHLITWLTAKLAVAS